MAQAPLTAADAVQLAFRQRMAARAAQASLEEARANRLVTGAYPSVHLETGVASRPDVTGGEDLTLYLPVDIFGRTQTGRRQGNADFAGARATFRQSLLDIQSDVLAAYIDLASAQELLRAGEESRDLAARLKRAADAQLDARAIAEVQQARAAFELKKAEQTSEDRRASVEAAQRRFEAALGLPSAASPAVSLDNLYQTTLTGNLERPDLMLLESNLARAEADKHAAQLLQAPSMEVQLRRSPWSSDQEQYGARLQFFVPIWDDGAARSTYRAANFRRESAMLLLKDKELSIQKEQAAATIEFNAATASVKSYRELVGEATRMMVKVQRGFELGGATLLDVLDARRSYNDTQEQLIGAEERLAAAVASLLKARGQILGEVKR